MSLGKFELNASTHSDIIRSFTSAIESLLESHQSMRIDKSLQIFVTVFGQTGEHGQKSSKGGQNMEDIPTAGMSEPWVQPPGTCSIKEFPTKGTKDFFKSKCLTASIIMASCILKYELGHKLFKAKGKAMRGILFESEISHKNAMAAAYKEYMLLVKRKILSIDSNQEHLISFACPKLSRHYGLNVILHTTKGRDDSIFYMYPSVIREEQASIHLHVTQMKDDLLHVSLINSWSQYQTKNGGIACIFCDFPDKSRGYVCVLDLFLKIRIRNEFYFFSFQICSSMQQA